MTYTKEYLKELAKKIYKTDNIVVEPFYFVFIDNRYEIPSGFSKEFLDARAFVFATDLFCSINSDMDTSSMFRTWFNTDLTETEGLITSENINPRGVFGASHKHFNNVFFDSYDFAGEINFKVLGYLVKAY